MCRLSFALVAAIAAGACTVDSTGLGTLQVTVSGDSTYILPRATLQATAAVGGAPAGQGVNWRSTNPDVASVSLSGLVTGIGAGQALITAESAGFADTLVVNVMPFPERSIAVGDAHACVLDARGRAHCWGANGSGQLGDGTRLNRTAPVAVAGDLVYESIEAGGNTTCGVITKGTAYCWGAGARGQLGNGAALDSAAPVEAKAPPPVGSALVGGAATLCALGHNGVAYCWGENGTGSAGTGDRAQINTPVGASTAVRFTQISVGLQQSCGIARDSTAYCWGSNAARTLGTGATAESLRPTRVAGDLRFQRLSAGSQNTCAIMTAGATYCWGSNAFGSLGTGRQGAAAGEGLAPARISGDPGFTRVYTGDANTPLTPNCGLTRTGAAFCWGASSHGQLGAATTETCSDASGSFGCASAPLAVSGGHSFDGLAIGSRFVCGITPDGRVLCWGNNESGILGSTAPAGTATPVRVAERLRLPRR